MASTKRDMRRPDLAVPYVEPTANSDAPDLTGTMSSSLPMVAIVTRNKLLGWVAVVFALQSWLAETPAKKKASSTPGYFSIVMAVMALFMGYLPLFLPPVPNKAGSGTQPPAAAPPS